MMVEGSAPMRNAQILLASLATACCSCASIDSPADRVPLTRETAAVRGCSFQSFVQSRDAYASRAEVESNLREEAIDYGGNVVLLLTNSAGEAYACAGPASMPAAGNFVPAEMNNRPPSYCPSFPFID
jgi:hypothetical protein